MEINESIDPWTYQSHIQENTHETENGNNGSGKVSYNGSSEGKRLQKRSTEKNPCYPNYGERELIPEKGENMQVKSPTKSHYGELNKIVQRRRRTTGFFMQVNG